MNTKFMIGDIVSFRWGVGRIVEVSRDHTFPHYPMRKTYKVKTSSVEKYYFSLREIEIATKEEKIRYTLESMMNEK